MRRIESTHAPNAELTSDLHTVVIIIKTLKKLIKIPKQENKSQLGGFLSIGPLTPVHHGQQDNNILRASPNQTQQKEDGGSHR